MLDAREACVHHVASSRTPTRTGPHSLVAQHRSAANRAVRRRTGDYRTCAILSGAILSGAILSGAILTGMILSGRVTLFRSKSQGRIDAVLVILALLAILLFVVFSRDADMLARASAHGPTWPFQTFGYIFAIPVRSFVLAASCWVPWLLVGAYVRPRGGHGVAFRAVWALGAGLIFWVFRDVVRSMGDAPSLLRDPLGSLVVGNPYTFLDELLDLYAP